MLVEQVRSDICCGDQAETGSAPWCLFQLEMAFGRDVREDQRRDVLLVARGGSRGRSVGKLCHEAPGSQSGIEFIKSMKRFGSPRTVVTDKLRCYGAALKEIGAEDRQETGRWLNNRSENSRQPFRRRERAMQRFRTMRSLQKFSFVHASVHNHFNLERHLYSRNNFKLNRAAALAEWRQLGAA